MKKLLFLFPVMLAVACTQSQNKVNGVSQSPTTTATPFKLTSPAFKEGENIPSVYTCDSTNISPELHWNKITGNVVSYLLIMDDPDAPMGTWVHWVVYNIPPSDTMLSQHYALDSNMAGGIRQGTTSFASTGYGGPCPPTGSHHYHFKLFAIDTTFNKPCKSTGEKALVAAMKGHILAETELVGMYQKKASK